MAILRSSSLEDSLSNNSERLLQRGEVGSRDYIRVFATKKREFKHQEIIVNKRTPVVSS